MCSDTWGHFSGNLNQPSTIHDSSVLYRRSVYLSQCPGLPPLLGSSAQMLISAQRHFSQRPSKSWGSRCLRVLLDPQIRIPAGEHRPELLIQGFDACLQEQMRAMFRPLPLVFLIKALADHLGDRGLDKARADPFPSTLTLAIIGDESAIALDVRVKLFNSFQEFAGCAICSSPSSSSQRCATASAWFWTVVALSVVSTGRKSFSAWAVRS